MTLALLPQAPETLEGLRVNDEAEAAARGLALVLGRDHEGRLALWRPCERAVPLCVDFLSGSLGYRLGADRTLHERLVRAVGRPAADGEHLIDATAGLGRDAALLAGAGWQLTLLERSPVLHALLADGLARLHEQQPELAGRMALYQGEAAELLAGMRATVVYLDPMFPERRKSAAVRKPLQWLQQLESPLSAEEEARLLERARAAASRRVVIKRPLRVPPLAGRKPGHSLRGRSVRFDVHPCDSPGGGG